MLFYHIQWYSFNVTDGDNPLSIKLEIYAGDPDVYVNPNNIVGLNDVAFNSKDHFSNEELVLEKEDRAKFNATKGIYYIGVYGKTAATYKISVKNSVHDVFLKSGLSESGYLDENQVRFYYFRDPILATNETDVSFNLHVMSGKARLRADMCAISEFDGLEEIKEKCNMTIQEML